MDAVGFAPSFSPNTSGLPQEAKVSSMTDWWSWKDVKWQPSRTLTATTNGGRRQRTTRCLTSPYPTSLNAMPHQGNESAKWTSRTCFWRKYWRRGNSIWKTSLSKTGLNNSSDIINRDWQEQNPDDNVVTTQWCQKGLSYTRSEKILIPKSSLRRSGDLIYHRYDSI